ncbi:MAG: hypothetical protein N2654_02215 [Deltaproteobacteria bacterium]|nr:hypothetical protein [Deltaproteobacteria bacterium]
MIDFLKELFNISTHEIFDGTFSGFYELNSFWQVGVLVVVGFIFVLLVVYKSGLLNSLSAFFITIYLFGFSLLPLVIVGVSYLYNVSVLSPLRRVVLVLSSLLVGHNCFLVYCLSLGFLGFKLLKNQVFKELLLIFTCAAFMHVFHIRPVFGMMPADPAILRWDPLYFSSKSFYDFERIDYGGLFSFFAIFAVITTTIQEGVTLKSILYIIILSSYFVFPQYGLLIVFICLLLLRWLDLKINQKLLVFFFLLFVPESLSSKIETFGPVLPVTALERLLDPVFPNSWIYIFLTINAYFLLNLKVYPLCVWIISLCVFFDPPVYSKKKLDAYFIESQFYPRYNLIAEIDSVVLGKVGFAKKFPEHVKVSGIGEGETIFVFRRPLSVSHLRIEWPSPLNRPVILMVRSPDNNCQKQINLRQLKDKNRSVALAQLTGITFLLNCKDLTSLLISDLRSKWEHPFIISDIYYN